MNIDWAHINWARVVAWLVLGPIALALVLYGWLLAANARDRKPSNDARAMEQILRDVPTVADAENGYVFAMGFDAEPAVKRSPAVSQLSASCRTVKRECLKAIGTADATAREWLETDQYLLRRYRELLAYRNWLATAPVSTRAPQPPFRTVSEGQTLLLATALQHAVAGEASQVRDLLDEDIRFWRLVLAHSENLVTKMTAVTALNRHFIWAGIMLKVLPDGAVAQAVPPQWKIPLSDAERTLRLSLAGEWQLANRRIEEYLERPFWPGVSESEHPGLNRFAWRLARPALKPQDYSNRLATLTLRVLKELDAPYTDYPEALQRARVAQRDVEQEHPPFDRVFNAVGDMLSTWPAGSLGERATRVADIEGIRRLALVMAELRSHSVDATGVRAALAASTLRNPYTDKPFGWIEKDGLIVFVGLDPNDVRRHAFVY